MRHCVLRGGVFDYWLAPQYSWPAALDDRLLGAGDSAGGHIAAMVAWGAVQAGGPALRGQLLLYSVIGHYYPPSPSYVEFAQGFFLERETMRWFIDQYLGQASAAQAFVLGAAPLAGLPPACILTAEFDPLRDEGQAYALRLREAGVPCEADCVAGMIHGFASQTDLHPPALQALRRACDWLRRQG